MYIWITPLLIFLAFMVYVFCFEKIHPYTQGVADFVSKRYEKETEQMGVVVIGTIMLPVMNKIPEKFKITVEHNGKMVELDTTKNVYENLIDGDRVKVLVSSNGKMLRICN